ncbi:MAG: hypothetical protein ACI9LD_001454 [Polaromonas sp.]|jgi:hypothetical protein
MARTVIGKSRASDCAAFLFEVAACGLDAGADVVFGILHAVWRVAFVFKCC